MNAAIIAKTASALAALDFSSENARIAELEAEALRCNEAISKAETRINEITAIIRTWEGPDGEAVADALLETDATDAANAGPDIAALESERTALRNGIGELNRRRAAAADEVRDIRTNAVAQKAGPATDALIQELVAKAKRAAVEIAESYAALSAIGDATRCSNAGNARFQVERATAGLFIIHSLLAGEGMNPIPVPADVLNMLAELDSKGAAVSKGWRRAVIVPY
jgi:chromosome segregation ATPase